MGQATVTAPTLQLLAWIAERRRRYAETIEAWKTSCPRLTVWEDAVYDRLVRVERGDVLLTATGSELLTQAESCEKTRSASASDSAEPMSYQIPGTSHV